MCLMWLYNKRTVTLSCDFFFPDLWRACNLWQKHRKSKWYIKKTYLIVWTFWWNMMMIYAEWFNRNCTACSTWTRGDSMTMNRLQTSPVWHKQNIASLLSLAPWTLNSDEGGWSHVNTLRSTDVTNEFTCFLPKRSSLRLFWTEVIFSFSLASYIKGWNVQNY